MIHIMNHTDSYYESEYFWVTIPIVTIVFIYTLGWFDGWIDGSIAWLKKGREKDKGKQDDDDGDDS